MAFVRLGGLALAGGLLSSLLGLSGLAPRARRLLLGRRALLLGPDPARARFLAVLASDVALVVALALLLLLALARRQVDQRQDDDHRDDDQDDCDRAHRSIP